ncbi:MAG: hypothetical protein ACREBC_39770, partial [Pyrinomonadaceae bacterium]
WLHWCELPIYLNLRKLADRKVQIAYPVGQHQHSLDNRRQIEEAHWEIDSIWNQEEGNNF